MGAPRQRPEPCRFDLRRLRPGYATVGVAGWGDGRGDGGMTPRRARSPGGAATSGRRGRPLSRLGPQPGDKTRDEYVGALTRTLPARSVARRLANASWIVLIGLPLGATVSAGHLGARALAGVGLATAVVVALYVGYVSADATFRRHWSRAQLTGFVLAGLTATSVLVLLGGPVWDYVYVYSLWPFLDLDRSHRLALPTLIALAVGAGLLRRITLVNLLAVVLVLLAVGLAIIGVRQLMDANVALSQAREDLARLAVAEERLRFARDLHELLGHSLTVIALKTEVALALLERDPARAAGELAGVEEVTRRALSEVREAVSGSRRPRLATEVANARVALRAAGIDSEESGASPVLPAETEAALAWALREAVTNVVRHSRARRCRLVLASDEATVTLTVTDDGPPTTRGRTVGDVAPDRPVGVGNGLVGVRERLVAVGGSLEVGPRREGGFVLSATVPRPAESPPAARGAASGRGSEVAGDAVLTGTSAPPVGR